MKLYVFESCPFCNKVRAILGLKGLACDIDYLPPGNFPADIMQHLSAQSVPVLAVTDNEQQLRYMQESADIMAYLDNKGTSAFAPYQASENVADLLQQLNPSLRRLSYPRMVHLDLPELKDEKGLAYFIESRQQRLESSFEALMANTPALLSEAEPVLLELSYALNISSLLNGQRQPNIDDVFVFADLRLLTMVAELSWPQPLRDFMIKMSALTEMSLFNRINQHGN